MNPEQTASLLPRELSDLGPYCLQYRVPKEHKQKRESDNKSHDWQAKS